MASTIDFISVGAFFLQWWSLSLIIMGFVLTVLVGCFMIVSLSKVIWRQVFPKKYYQPQYKD